ncbi:MAG: Hpt domain-containing protein [Marinomonas foliarum]|jgi:histidine phosphotransfer protein HptB|uniref:HPt (Histidine-containing phosphotransfer) domain-containing protein n=1 Tax=Marinomonas foliarum TaxID=491950 RepID=A0A369AC74_9GAMM|nr:Hpt domain-containing protein [Marinomonas foliarum]RCX06751.1 HPt (histidine-containing phosphotransfer) domain-containing protein [Marinomonas foliarum]
MIDHAHLNSLIQLIGKDTMNDIRLEFIADSQEKMALLFQAWHDKDYDTLKNIGHSLKSASLNMALRMLAEQYQQIERLAAQHNNHDMQAIMDQLPALHEASLKELDNLFINGLD